jgi:hypothetical protein
MTQTRKSLMLSKQPFREHVRCVMLEKTSFSNTLKPTCKLPRLPPEVAIETMAVLKVFKRASLALADLKGHASATPCG